MKAVTDEMLIVIRRNIFELIPIYEYSNDLFFENMKKTGVIMTNDVCKCATLTASFGSLDMFTEKTKKYSSTQVHNILENLTNINDESIFSTMYSYNFDMFRVFIFTKKAYSAEMLQKKIESITQSIVSRFYELLEINISLHIDNIFVDVSEFRSYMQDEHIVSACSRQISKCIYSSNVSMAASLLNDYRNLFKKGSWQLLTMYKLVVQSIEQLLATKITISEDDEDVIYDQLISIIKYTLPKHINDDTVINNALSYIKNNYANNISLASVASYCYLSPSYFSVFFKTKTGVSFASYLSNLRLDKAKYYLTQTDTLITNISELCGFNSASYFHKFFRRSTGMTPIEYRNKYSQKENDSN